MADKDKEKSDDEVGRKIFVSYKFADDDVKELSDRDNPKEPTTVRDYVNIIEKTIEGGRSIYKGESDGDDLSELDEDTIWEKLRDRIYDSSVTILLISPNMKEQNKAEKLQWIPHEISYSLCEQSRRLDNDEKRISHPNALLAVILPDRYNDIGYYYEPKRHFRIVSSNIKSRYGLVVYWDSFIEDMSRYVEDAIKSKENADPDTKI